MFPQAPPYRRGISSPSTPGKRSRLCILGPGACAGPCTSVGDDCLLKNVETESSIVMNGPRIESGKRIVDSLIGATRP